MAILHLELSGGYYKGNVAGFPFEFPANKENKYALILFFRGFKNASGKQGLFSQQQIAEALPDFEGKTRQSVDEHERHFRESDHNLRHYLTRKRKVDETVVNAALEELLKSPFILDSELAERVNKCLGREDITSANARAALEQISFLDVRDVIKTQLETGQAHYKETYLLEVMMRTYSSEAGENAGFSVPERDGMTVSRLAAIEKLTTPDVPISEIPMTLFWITFALRLYFLGVPLTTLGQWFHVHPTTVLRWILSLALALWPRINGWIQASVNCSKAYIDEKWIKLKGKWHYWFVVLDADTGLPIYQTLLARRSAASVKWIVSELKRIKNMPKVIITDGLAAYKSVFGKIDTVKHLLCRFHHQLDVTRWLKDHFPKEEDVTERKKAMKKVFQTNDKRTVRRRLARLKERAVEWGIEKWVELTEKNLPNLLPSVGSRYLPSTTNTIERFFGTFSRFYKVRRGFHSVTSTTRELTLFLVVYTFSKQSNGKAPIERILPEANRMPLYRIFNDPFSCLMELSGGDAENIKNVKGIRDMADFLTSEAEAA